MEGNQILSPKCDTGIEVRDQKGKNKDNYMHWIVHFHSACMLQTLSILLLKNDVIFSLNINIFVRDIGRRRRGEKMKIKCSQYT